MPAPPTRRWTTSIDNGDTEKHYWAQRVGALQFIGPDKLELYDTAFVDNQGLSGGVVQVYGG
ncbi:MAG: hypothetical protein AAFV53_22860 [Myxococcota bacterium]